MYGLGTYPDGRPYYAMRFIRGDSLADTIREADNGMYRDKVGDRPAASSVQ